MKRRLSLAAVLAFILIAPTMYGQTSHLRLRFHVPFSFSVNKVTIRRSRRYSLRNRARKETDG